jgi:hypothetical protein
MLRYGVGADVQILASEVFNRSWQFIETDPVLAGEDRQQLQEQLAKVILEVMSAGERNLWVIANRAIGALREQQAAKRVEEAA